MVKYVPSTNPQVLGSQARTVNQYRELHEEHFRKYGPPPSNFYVERKVIWVGKLQRARMFYADHAANNTITDLRAGGSYNHPFSPEGLQHTPAPVISPEMEIDRIPSPGLFEPPLKYRPGLFRWKHHPNWQSAIAAELTYHGESAGGNPLTVEHINSKWEALVAEGKHAPASSHILYHAADRGTAVWKDEPSASVIARFGAKNPYSLIVVCPFVSADGTAYDRVYDMFNRPPFRGRWSTGDFQAVYKPLVVMCMPKVTTPRGREFYHKDVEWFTMELVPNSAFEKTWIEMWKPPSKENADLIIKGFNFPVSIHPDRMSWVVVLLHRRIALGTAIPDDQLGPWIFQYMEHMHKDRQARNAQPFTFDPDKTYHGTHITYDTLTAWILNGTLGPNTREYAKRWDDAIAALAKYNICKTKASWDDCRSTWAVAQTPFW